jgi:hypothetical protein
MAQDTGGAGARRLRAVGAGTTGDPVALGEEIVAAVGAAPGGLAPRALRAAVAERLGRAEADVSVDGLTTALGLAIATGRVDEAGGRLVAVSQEQRRAV